eukprot:1137776-Pelagomonas_calceolata.AAC.1
MADSRVFRPEQGHGSRCGYSYKTHACSSSGSSAGGSRGAPNLVLNQIIDGLHAIPPNWPGNSLILVIFDLTAVSY